MQLVIVRLSMTMHVGERDAYIALASMRVRSRYCWCHNAAGHELEGIGVQGSNGIYLHATWFQLV